MQHNLSQTIRYIGLNENKTPEMLQVNTVGFESIADHTSYPSGGHPREYDFSFEHGRTLHEYQILYLTKGQGHFRSKSIPSCIVPEGSVIFLFPGEWHTYRPDESTGWESYWVGFDGDPARRLFAENRISPANAVLKLGYDEEIVGLYRKILDVSKTERPGFRQLLSGMTIHLLAYLFYRGQDQNWKDKEVLNKIEKARLMMREKFNTQVSPEEIAASLNMSYTWFRRTFRQYSGLAPAQYITRLRMQRARELLSFSNLSVKQVAIESGFESYDYFSVAFKRYMQMTPGEFRNQGKSLTAQKS